MTKEQRNNIQTGKKNVQITCKGKPIKIALDFNRNPKTQESMD